MLGCEYHALHSGSNECLHPLLAVEACRVECLRVGVAISPLTVVECVQSEVDEGVSLHFLPVYLLLLGQRQQHEDAMDLHVCADAFTLSMAAHANMANDFLICFLFIVVNVYLSSVRTSRQTQGQTCCSLAC